jgi:hypothetical protein
VTSRARWAAGWAVVALLSLGGVGLGGSGLLVRETAWVHLTSFSSDAAGERYRESRRSATTRARDAEEERERARAEAAQRAAGERRVLVGGALSAVGVALGAWLGLARLRARRNDARTMVS